LKLPPEYCGFFQEKASFDDFALDIATTQRSEKTSVARFFILPVHTPRRTDCRFGVSAITLKSKGKNDLGRASTTLSILSALQGESAHHFPTEHAHDGLIRDLCRCDEAALVGPRGWLEAAPKGDSFGLVVLQRVPSAANFAQPEMLHGMGVGWPAFLDRALGKTKQLAVPMMECR
jgi:hypothetical protein